MPLVSVEAASSVAPVRSPCCLGIDLVLTGLAVQARERSVCLSCRDPSCSCMILCCFAAILPIANARVSSGLPDWSGHPQVLAPCALSADGRAPFPGNGGDIVPSVVPAPGS